MTYTLVFRVTREVWDALERGEKTVEWRDETPFWNIRIAGALRNPGNGQALFLCGKRKARYEVAGLDEQPRNEIPLPWRNYIKTDLAHVVELGRRVEP